MLRDLVARPWDDYRLLDSGGGRKLEVLGGHPVIRPSSQALWAAQRPEAWATALSECRRHSDGGGHWEHRQEPGELRLHWQGEVGSRLELELRLTDFGHCGVFVEQEPIWRWAQERLAGISSRSGRCANLFGYTGAASLAAAAVGAEVFHVDSAKGVLDWGRGNAERSAVDGVRWIHDDVRSWLALSRKRGWRYDVVLVDPPSFGHGKKKQEVWNLERDLVELVDDCLAITADDGLLVLSCHTPGVQREALVNLLRPAGGCVIAGELGVAHAGDERVLPAGVYAALDRAAAANGLGGAADAGA